MTVYSNKGGDIYESIFRSAFLHIVYAKQSLIYLTKSISAISSIESK